MRTLRNILVATFILVLPGKSLFGQNTGVPRINANFTGVRFSEFVTHIESLSNVHFFYDPQETDSLRITFRAEDMPLNLVLDRILAGTGLYSSIDENLRVFVTRRFAIRTQLPADILAGGSKNPAAAIDTSRLPSITPESREPAVLAENRLYVIGSQGGGGSRATIAGYVRDIKNGEPILGATVTSDSIFSVNTDQYGYYAITLSRGSHVLRVSSLGMQDANRRIELRGDGKLNIELRDHVATLKDVIVLSERRSNTRSLTMGADLLTMKTIKQVPVVFGEADVLKVVMTLPGVTSTGEASTGFNVRGGSTDQNLILFSDATIYNPSHLFGFFSAFNPDVVKGVELYKSSIPAKYGGRLSSVLDVTTRDGNSKKITGSGGIGPITSKLTLEGPLVKDKASFIVAGRTSYSDWLLHSIPNNAYQNSSASFYDLNFLFNYDVNPKNSIYISGYLSNDRFRLNSDTLYKYGNQNANIKWKHIFNNRFYSVLTAGLDHYFYSVSSENNPVTAFNLNFKIDQTDFRADFNYTPSNKHRINFGLNTIYYKLQPGTITPMGAQSLIIPDSVQYERALESALYLGDEYAVTDRLSISGGVRYSIFNYLGPQDVYGYLPGVARDKNSLTDTTHYGSGSIVKTYQGPEVRLSLRYSLPGDASIKAGYNTLRQYIHLLSNTTAISPTDVWKLSDPNIRPQLGSQYSLGYYKNFNSGNIETSLEVYYKDITNFLDYKSGAVLVLNHHIETDVINSKGYAYGAELLIKKNSGKFNGWASYTYSRTFLRSDDPTAGETVNGGSYYPANYDKPHNANVIANYRFSHRLSLSGNIVYSTGRPITLPISVFNLGGSQRVYYSDRNEYRIPDYFRMDLSFTLEGNHKVKQAVHNSWSFGVYNLTARKNAYSVYFREDGGVIKGYKLSIFGTAIPFVTYNFRF